MAAVDGTGSMAAADLGSGSAVVALTANAAVAFSGECTLRLLAGEASLAGHVLRLDRQHYICAPSLMSAPVLEASSAESAGVALEDVSGVPADAAAALQATLGAQTALAAVLLLESTAGPAAAAVKTVRSHAAAFAVPTPLVFGATFGLAPAAVSEVTPSICPPAWADILAQFGALAQAADPRAPPVLLVCGGKDVGKSTFARFAVNSLLNTHPEVLFLDSDLGQSEFCPPGLVSLHAVTEPLFSPPLAHQQVPLASHFLGCTAPRNDPRAYISAVQSLVAVFRTRCETLGAVPLVVNTHGWVKGLGLPLIGEVIRSAQPSLLVQLQSSVVARNLPDLKAALANGELTLDPLPSVYSISQVVQITSVEGIQQPGKFESLTLRTMGLQAYFRSPLATLPPYSIGWEHVAVSFLHHSVPDHEILRALNATVVGLCHSPVERPVGALPVVEAGYEAECIGLGVIRAIDPEQQLFFIITPLSPAQLAQVNLLVRGELELPSLLLLQDVIGSAPYATTEFSSANVVGRGQRKTRTNLGRK
eukprot:m.24193 g.24193  ORF g.24193 m.24193 type:complete len:535 (-) comp4241_c0_seq1:131-1735(-)